jgi:hypothetical protein
MSLWYVAGLFTGPNDRRLKFECGIMSKEKWQVKNVHRHLNERTIKDSYALSRSEEILDSLDRNHYYTVLEKKYGYHQVEVEESLLDCSQGQTIGG